MTNSPVQFGYRIRFAFTRRWVNPKLKCPDLAACPEVLNPIKFSDQKTPANPSILTLLMDPEKKTAVNVAVVGKQTLKAICNLSPPQRFNEALLDYPIANI